MVGYWVTVGLLEEVIGAKNWVDCNTWPHMAPKKMDGIKILSLHAALKRGDLK